MHQHSPFRHLLVMLGMRLIAYNLAHFGHCRQGSDPQAPCVGTGPFHYPDIVRLVRKAGIFN